MELKTPVCDCDKHDELKIPDYLLQNADGSRKYPEAKPPVTATVTREPTADEIALVKYERDRAAGLEKDRENIVSIKEHLETRRAVAAAVAAYQRQSNPPRARNLHPRGRPQGVGELKQHIFDPWE